MPYRPLNHNEYAIVQRTLYDVRGLNEGFAESLFMAYKAKALHDDVPENDISHIRNQLESFAKKYPGLRQGVISNYELYFGDPSQFSYEQVKRRKTFLTNQEARNLFLTFYNLPINWSITDIKDFLRKVGIESGSLSPAQVEQWNNKEFAIEL